MPFFDPLTSWITVLIADGIMVADEKCKGPSKSELDRKHVKQSNDMLNADIRRIKEKYGLVLADMAYDQIQLHIKITREGTLFQLANGQIELTPENQDYIIEVLEKCVSKYSKYSYKEAKTKYQYYKSALITAKERKF